MDAKTVSPDFAASAQLSVDDVEAAAAAGFRALIVNRPDGEALGQPRFAEIEAAAQSHGLAVRHIPLVLGRAISDADVAAFEQLRATSPGPTLAFCGSGKRAVRLWAAAEAVRRPVDEIIEAAAAAGFDVSGDRARLEARARGGAAAPAAKNPAASELSENAKTFDIVIVGAGAGGLAAAASILRCRPGADIAVIEPAETHHYQPGWALVGGGLLRARSTMRAMARVMPSAVYWIRGACASFSPERNEITLASGARVSYRVLIVAPGLKLDWDAVEGLRDTLGRNGVTSNYRGDLAPYTWELIRGFKGGRALFTQPATPIKCPGAPQNAMHLACDAWRRMGLLDDAAPSFHAAGGALFGVNDYVPALMRYVEAYGVQLRFSETLKAVDGARKKATFSVVDVDGSSRDVTRDFDMLHVCPPQTGLDFVRESPLANADGWIDVDPETMRHVRFDTVFALGDASSTPNAKTAAAVRMQAPVVAVNALDVLDGRAPSAVYGGYGACPLIVERGKVVLAEFSYDGKLDPTFPTWLFDGRAPSRLAWFLTTRMLPTVYFDLMLRGRELLAQPTLRETASTLQPTSGADEAQERAA